MCWQATVAHLAAQQLQVIVIVAQLKLFTYLSTKIATTLCGATCLNSSMYKS